MRSWSCILQRRMNTSTQGIRIWNFHFIANNSAGTFNSQIYSLFSSSCYVGERSFDALTSLPAFMSSIAPLTTANSCPGAFVLSSLSEANPFALQGVRSSWRNVSRVHIAIAAPRTRPTISPALGRLLTVNLCFKNERPEVSIMDLETFSYLFFFPFLFFLTSSPFDCVIRWRSLIVGTRRNCLVIRTVIFICFLCCLIWEFLIHVW